MHVDGFPVRGRRAVSPGQETLPGIGGVRMLQSLGYGGIQKFHMNEGHASLLVLELLRRRNGSDSGEWDFHGVRSQCVFTTHTPVPVSQPLCQRSGEAARHASDSVDREDAEDLYEKLRYVILPLFYRNREQ